MITGLAIGAITGVALGAAAVFLLGRASNDQHSTAASTAVATTVVAEAVEDPPPEDAPATFDEDTVVHDAVLMERLSAALDQVDHAVVIAEAEGTVVFRNAAAEDLFTSRDGRSLVQAAVQELLMAAVDGHPGYREVDLFGPPAQSYVVTAVPFGESPRHGADLAVSSGATVVVQDRSLQKRTETVRRDFVANISHELKTPIGALGLLAETILDEPELAVINRLSRRMVDEAERASRTIDDLLELSRIEFGDDSETAELSAASVAAEASSRLSAAMQQAGIGFRQDIDEGLVVRGDRRQLVSALSNLVDNAVKYSEAGGEIVIEAEAVEPDRVAFRVIDNGIGIPRRDLDRVFERFYRVDRARSRGTGGTGLGLAIVRHVASNHSGEVTVSSTEGVGSVFELILPVGPDRVSPPHTTSADTTSPHAATSTGAVGTT